MIPLIGYNEDVTDFPNRSVDMRPVCTPEVRARLRQLFGAARVEYIGRGYNNAHHRLVGVPGQPDLVVRRVLAPVKALALRLDREYRALQHLAQHGYPHAPRPIRRIKPEEVDGSPAIAMTFVEGTPIHFDADVLTELGRAVGRLHALPVPDWLARAGTTTEPMAILMAMWSNFQRNFAAVQHGMSAEHSKRAAHLIKVLPAYLQDLDWRDAKDAVLHGDLGDHNVLQNGSGTMLIDWEFASVSDPTLDIMWLFGREGFGQEERNHFYQGYRDTYAGEISPAWHERLRVLSVVAMLELVLWAQSCVNDIIEGRNLHYFEPGDKEYLERQVTRIHEVAI